MQIDVDAFPTLSGLYELNSLNRRTFVRDLQDICEDMPNNCQDLSAPGDWMWDFTYSPSLYQEPIDVQTPAFAVLMNAMAFSGVLLRATRNIEIDYGTQDNATAFNGVLLRTTRDIEIVDYGTPDSAKVSFTITLADTLDEMNAKALRPISERPDNIGFYFRSCIAHDDLCFRLHQVKEDREVCTTSYENGRVIECESQFIEDCGIPFVQYVIKIEMDLNMSSQFSTKLTSNLIATAALPIKVKDQEVVELDIGRLSHLISIEGHGGKLFRRSAKLVLEHIGNGKRVSKHAAGRKTKRTNRRRVV
jgi:hypothetical protein